MFGPIEVGEVRTEPLDNMVEQVSAYYKVVGVVISSSAVVLDLPPSIEILVVTGPIQAQVASISTTLYPDSVLDSYEEQEF